MAKVIAVWPENRAYGIITIIQNYFLSIIISVYRNNFFGRDFCFYLNNRIAFTGLLKIVFDIVLKRLRTDRLKGHLKDRLEDLL